MLDSTEIIDTKGGISAGTSLPKPRYGHCMLSLEDGRIIIIGGQPVPHWGLRNSAPKDRIISSKSTWFYDGNSFTSGPRTRKTRFYHACATFKSALHQNREVVLVAGGFKKDDFEILDYQTKGSEFVKSK